ncbi:MAG: hypothetical protein FK733_12330 [Asgard group archaeon]|nr:hypothetical protein [Asgard group archaeon]
MRCLAIADTHLGYQAGKTAEARKFMYNQMFSVFSDVLDIAREKKVDYVLHGGDIFNRSKPPKKTIHQTYQLIEELLKDDIGFLVTPGNHERSKLPNTLLRFHPKCHIFTKFDAIALDDYYKLIGFPYSSNVKQEVIPKIEKVTQENTENSFLMLCHQLFDGAEFGPKRFRFTLAHGSMDPLIMPTKLKLIITGHIHRAQKLHDGFIVYPGSTERTSFVEAIEPKGYLLIDLASDSLQVSFQELNSIPMTVIEINLKKQAINIQELKDKISKGLIRTLVRFTGRSLSSVELTQLSEKFPTHDYPLLTITPRFPIQELQPLFEIDTSKFSFEPFER